MITSGNCFNCTRLKIKRGNMNLQQQASFAILERLSLSSRKFQLHYLNIYFLNLTHSCLCRLTIQSAALLLSRFKFIWICQTVVPGLQKKATVKIKTQTSEEPQDFTLKHCFLFMRNPDTETVFVPPLAFCLIFQMSDVYDDLLW